MPPQRIRNAFDDSRSEASSTKDKQPVYTGISKGRRNGTSVLAGSNLKDVTNAETTSSEQREDATASVRLRCISDQVNVLIATNRSTGHLSILLCSMRIATCIVSTPHPPSFRHTIKGCLRDRVLDSIALQWYGIVHGDVPAKIFWPWR